LFPHLGLCDYPKIRNSGLIVAQLLGVDTLLFMDNDEVIRNPKFLPSFHNPKDVPGRYLRFQEEWEIFMKELSTTGLKNTVKECGYNLD
jgi:hypothetical protein